MTVAVHSDQPRKNTRRHEVEAGIESARHVQRARRSIFTSTCPKSMIVTTKMYNPNMKVEILAIPPRVDPGNVCCKWRFSMRTPDAPEYVQDAGEIAGKSERD